MVWDILQRQRPDMPHVTEFSAGINAQISSPFTPQEIVSEKIQRTF